MTKWTYLVEFIETFNLPNRLTYFGEHGWELVTMKDSFYIFKKPKYSESQD
jgi:hypothetical protein